MSEETNRLAAKLEKLGIAARLQDLAFLMGDGESMRLQKILKVLDHLDPGVYLVGTGPYTQGVYSLMCDEVVLGRLATVLEKPLDQPVDILVNDAVSLNPREVSRIHCSIYRQEGVEKHDYWIIDRGSTCGTYVNSEKLEPSTTDNIDGIRLVSRSLTEGDVISLGSSFVNTFLFVDLRA